MVMLARSRWMHFRDGLLLREITKHSIRPALQAARMTFLGSIPHHVMSTGECTSRRRDVHMALSSPFECPDESRRFALSRGDTLDG